MTTAQAARYQMVQRLTGLGMTFDDAQALRRVAGIMARYPALTYYVQRDPRGHSLYILRSSDVPEGQSAEDYYARGVAIY